MKPQIPWLRVFVEGVVIVGSILLAFGIDAAWEGRQDRQEEQNMLVELRSEFEVNREALLTTAQDYRETLGAMRALVLASAVNTSLPTASLDTLFAQAAVPPHWQAATGALMTAVNSGRITLLRNAELRNRLAGWDGVTSDLTYDEATRGDFVYRELRPALAGFGIGGGPSEGSAANSDFRGALQSRMLVAHLRSQIVNITHILTHYADVEEAIDALIADLTEELSSL